MVGKMIFVSDFEGCAPSFGSKKQSQVLCSQDFFNKIKVFLEHNPLNKISFLGDYFDKGKEVDVVIRNIINLYEMFNIKGESKRVYIILGNRDINKLRLQYEFIKKVDMKVKTVDTSYISTVWKIWNNTNYYKDYLDDTKYKVGTKQLLEFILEKSMTAKVLDTEHSDNVFEYFNYIFNDKINNNKKYKSNFFKLFEYGNIVEYDKDYKVLLSHAGGMDSFFFHSQKYYDDIVKNIESSSSKHLDYFQKLELARTKLMIEPIEDQIYLGFQEFYKKDDLDKIITILNSPLRKYLNNPTINNGYYYLLQALCLKPDNDKHFVSFVESCDGASKPGCIGPRIDENMSVRTKELTNIMKKKIGMFSKK